MAMTIRVLVLLTAGIAFTRAQNTTTTTSTTVTTVTATTTPTTVTATATTTTTSTTTTTVTTVTATTSTATTVTATTVTATTITATATTTTTTTTTPTTTTITTLTATTTSTTTTTLTLTTTTTTTSTTRTTVTATTVTQTPVATTTTEEGTEQAVVSMIVVGIGYDDLSTSQKMEMESGAEQVVADQAGPGITKNDVVSEVLPGSVLIRSVITPPAGRSVTADTVITALSDFAKASALATGVLDVVNAVPGIDHIRTGTVDVAVPVVSKRSVPFTTPTSTPAQGTADSARSLHGAQLWLGHALVTALLSWRLGRSVS